MTGKSFRKIFTRACTALMAAVMMSHYPIVLQAAEIVETETAAETLADIFEETEPLEEETVKQTEPPYTQAESVIIGEDVLDAESITDRKLSGGIVQVCIGYLFDDGSYDIWYTAPGFAVNSTTVITSTDAVISYGSDIYTRAVDEKSASYACMGIDLADYNTAANSIVYRVYAGGNRLLSANKVSDPLVNGHFTVLSVKGLIGNPYKVLASAPTEDMNLYAVGVIGAAVTTDHLLDGMDFVEQKVSIGKISAAEKIVFSSPADEYFDICPLVTEDGAIAGVIEQYSPDGESTAITSVTLEGILSGLGITCNFQNNEEIKRSDVDVQRVNDLIAAADDAPKKNLTEESGKRLDNAVKNAKEGLENEALTQDEADRLAEELSEAIAFLEYEEKSYLGIILLAAVACIIAGSAAYVAVTLFMKSKNTKEPFGDEEEAIEDAEDKGNDGIVEKIQSFISGIYGKVRTFISERQTVVKFENKKDLKKKERSGEARTVTESKKTVDGSKEEAPAGKGKKQSEFPNLERYMTVAESDPGEEAPVDEPKAEKEETKSSAPAEAEVPAEEQEENVFHKSELVYDLDEDTDKAEKTEGTKKDDIPADADETEDEDEMPTRLLKNPDEWVLILESTGEEKEITETPFLVGKTKTAQLHIKNGTVSRRHFEVTEENGAYFIRDLGSLNGTTLNDLPLLPDKKYELKDNDVIIASDEKITFHNRKEDI